MTTGFSIRLFRGVRNLITSPSTLCHYVHLARTAAVFMSDNNGYLYPWSWEYYVACITGPEKERCSIQSCQYVYVKPGISHFHVITGV